MCRHLLAFGCVLFITTLATAQDKAKLPEGAVFRIGMHRLRVSGAIFDHAFTPDQRTLIVAYDERDSQRPNVVLFDVATGLERKRLPIRGAQHIAMAKDKPLLAVDTFNGIEVWDVANLKQVRQLDYPECTDEASALTISPDGSQVIAATPALLRWNVQTGEALTAFQPRSTEFPIQSLQFTTDGSKLVTSETYQAEFNSSSRYSRRRKYSSYDREFDSILFEGVNWYLLPVSGIIGPRARLLHTTTWSIGSNFVYRPRGPMTTVWDAKTGATLIALSNEQGRAVVSPDGTIAGLTSRNNLTYDRRMILVRLEKGWPVVGSFPGAEHAVFSPDGKQVVIDANELWDIPTRKLVCSFDAPMYSSVRFSPDGKLLAVVKSDGSSRYDRYPEGVKYFNEAAYVGRPSSEQNHLQLIEVATGKPRSYADGYADAVRGLAYSPDGKWLASFSQETIFIHDAKTGAELRRWSAHKFNIEQIAFSPDGKTLASSSLDTTIGLWDPATGKERKRLTYGNQPEYRIAFTPGGKTLISLTQDGAVRRWNLTDGKHIDSTQPVAMVASSLAATGEYVACLEMNRETNLVHMKLMRTRTGKNLPPSETHVHFAPQSGSDSSLAFCSDGKLLAGSGYLPIADDKFEHVVRVWETATQREVVRFPCKQPPTRLLAMSPDARLLAHGFAVFPNNGGAEELYLRGAPLPGEHAILLRDLVTAQGAGRDDDKTLRPITGHLGPITCLAFSPDGKFLATGSTDQVVYVWRVEHFFKPADVPPFKGEVAELWPHLAEADAGKAYRAIASLERRPVAAVALLRKHLQPAEVTEPKVIEKHVRDLSGGSFAVRAQANAALEKLGAEALPQLKAAVLKPADLEVKRRLEALLDKVDRPYEVADNIRAYRALTLLERIGTAEARELLEVLSRGAPSSWLTVEARHSLQRVAQRP